MNLLIFIILFLLTIFIGSSLVSLITDKLESWENIGLAYIVGMGIVTYCMFFANLLGFAYNQTNLAIIVLSLSAALSIICLIKKKKPGSFSLNLKSLTRAELAAFFLMLIISLLLLISSAYWPVKDWDSLVLYDFRAKVFADTGFMQRAIEEGYFFGYPLMTSLAHTFFYINSVKTVGLVHSLFYVSFLIIIFANLKQYISRRSAILWTLLLCLTPELFGPANMTYTNLAYSVYLVSSVFYLMRGIQKNDNGYLVLSAVILGLSTWVRSSEPFWLILILIAWKNLFSNRKFKLMLFYPAIVYSFIYPWKKFEQMYTANAETVFSKLLKVLKTSSLHFDPLDFVSVVKYFYYHIIATNKLIYLLLFVSLTMTYIYRRKFTSRAVKIMRTFILSSLLLTFVGVLLFSMFYDDWQSIGGSATRMTLFLIPSSLFISAIVFEQKFLEPKRQRSLHK